MTDAAIHRVSRDANGFVSSVAGSQWIATGFQPSQGQKFFLLQLQTHTKTNSEILAIWIKRKPQRRPNEIPSRPPRSTPERPH